MRYKTCVSVAEDSPIKLKKVVCTALKKSDYVEIRLDFLKAEQIPKALDMLRKELEQSVCTLRPKLEGGRFAGNEKERTAILKLVAEYNPFLLDVEFNTLRKNRELREYLKSTKTNILVSWHNFKKTPSFSELNNQMEKMAKFSPTIKIVTMAKSVDDSTRILQLYSKKRKRRSLIAFTMGSEGRISRILCLFLGSPFTYVSLGKPIAPGQFSVDEVKKITNLKI